MTASESRTVAAFHEAGHAVAAVMRGGSTLISVTLDEQVHGAGITWSNHKPCDLAFFAWAGPWAEARHAWGDRPLDGEDDEGRTFGDYVMGVLLEQQPADGADYARAARANDAPLRAAGLDVDALRAASEQVVWPGELEAVWPAVERVAARLLAGETVTHDQVEALVDDC